MDAGAILGSKVALCHLPFRQTGRREAEAVYTAALAQGKAAAAAAAAGRTRSRDGGQ